MIAHRLGVALILGSLAFPGFAWAESEDYFPGSRIEKARYETSAAPYASKTFAQLDTNRDGKISADEAHNRPIPEPFEELDRNRDGVLTPREYGYLSH